MSNKLKAKIEHLKKLGEIDETYWQRLQGDKNITASLLFQAQELMIATKKEIIDLEELL